MHNHTPRNLQDLQSRCQQIAGKTIGHLAEELKLRVPNNLLQAKGWIGQLLEAALGASATSKAIVDFPELGVELKTIPISSGGKPLESTYVCTVQTNANAYQWRDSWVYQKLRHVLWVPFVADDNLPIPQRIIVQPFLWQMDPAMENILRTDWEELMDLLMLGEGKKLSAKFGTFLHIRPKAANNRILVDYLEHDGNHTKIVPKGFYLRTSFTQRLLATYITL